MTKLSFRIRLKKGDTVMVRGRTGKILAVHPKTNKVTVEGINIVKRHFKPTRANPQGGIIEINKPIAVSKVGINDSNAKKPSRLSYQLSQSGTKSRIMTTSGKEIK
jgi:large subunit ribosomal protein L24